MTDDPTRDDEEGTALGESAAHRDPDVTLVSWNVHGFRGLTPAQLRGVEEALASTTADVVVLQEVPASDIDGVRAALARLNLPHVAYPHSAGHPRLGERQARHGVLIAARWPLVERDRSWTGTIDFPELLADVDVQMPGSPFAVVAAHIPNGSGNGWELKTRALEAVARRIETVGDRATVIAGDFNEPDEFLADGRVTTFTQHDRRVNAVDRIFCSSRVRHAWCDVHGVSAAPITFRLDRASGSTKRRFDHVFVSSSIVVREADYRHSWRIDGRSDHSAAVVRLAIRASEA
jgi:endonuclease/exonuclease/phosphatase family metal-dependent hydrolase